MVLKIETTCKTLQAKDGWKKQQENEIRSLELLIANICTGDY